MPTPSTADPLDDAFTREKAVLEAERQALEDEYARTETLGAERLARLQATLDARRDTLDQVRARIDALETESLALESRLEATEARRDLLETTLTHAWRTLADADTTIAWPSDSIGVAARVEWLLTRGLARADRLGRVVSAEGTFFDANGEETHGVILHVGTVAALSPAEDGGVLAPAGNGVLQVVDASGRAAARAWMDGDPPALVPVHLSEDADAVVEEGGGLGFGELLRAGGVLVWPILILAAVALVIVIERLVTLARVGAVRPSIADITARLRAGDVDGAREACRVNESVVGRVVVAAIDHRARGREAIDDAVASAILRETPRLERLLTTLRVIAAVSPLLGLLGTVTGMISTFEVLTQFGAGNAKLLSGGISEALITTELGLAVAIPVLLVHNALSGRVDRLLADMEHYGLTVGLALHDGGTGAAATVSAGGERRS